MPATSKVVDITEAERPAQQGVIEVEAWEDARFDSVLGQDGEVYLPIRGLCKYLGIDSQMQIRTLRKRRNYKPHIRAFWLTATRGGGRQAVWCMNVNRVAFWIGNLDVDLVRPELQDGLIVWQDTLARAAHILYFGGGRGIEDLSQLSREEVEHRLLRAELKIASLTYVQRIQGRRLSTLERVALPPGTYYDVDGSDEE